MKLVYTAIFGNYDKLWEPNVVSEGWEHICFTDNENIKSKIWRVVKINPPHDNKAKSSKYVKIMTNPGKDDVFIWVDGSIEIKKDLNEFIKKVPDCDLSMQKHPFNETLEQELSACVRMKKDKESVMRKQVERYTLSTPYQFTQNNIIVKRGNIQLAMERWWEEVKNWSKRDQLSFVWTMQQINQEYCTFSNQLANEFFKWHSIHPK